MTRLLVGLAIGAVLGAFGHAWLAAPSSSAVDAAAATSSANARAAASSGSQTDRWNTSPFARTSAESAQPVAMTTSADAIQTASDAPATNATATTDAATSAAPSTSSESDPAKSADDAASDHPKTNTFLSDAYSRAIAEDRAHPRSPSQWDEDFSEEPRDPSWASSTEHRLSSYFGNAASRGVTLMGVQCHQTLCEMKLSEPMGVPDQFHNVMDDWFHSGAAFGAVQSTGTAGDNGQRYIVAIVRKWQKP